MLSRTGIGMVSSNTGAATVMTRTIVAITPLPSAMTATIGAVEVRPSVTMVKSASDRNIAADISMLESSFSKATVTK